MKKRIKRVGRYVMILGLVSRGFSVKRAREWTGRVRKDLKRNKDYNLIDKRWAYKNGYMPDYAETFGITDANLHEHISERDYYYLQPINGTYRKWLANKVTTRKIFSPYHEFLPEHYYKLNIKKNGKFKAQGLEDCPMEGHMAADVIQMIQEKGVVAVSEPRRNRSAVLRYENEVYYFQGEEFTSKRRLFRRIRRFHRRPLLMEYVEPADEFKNQFHEFGNNLRLVVCHKVGEAPQITEAYLRIGAHYTKDLSLTKHEVCVAYGIESKYEDFLVEDEEIEDELVDESEPLDESETEPEDESLYANEQDDDLDSDNDQDNDTVETEAAEREAEKIVRKKDRYFGGIIIPIDIETGEYKKGKLLMNGEVYEVDTDFVTGKKIEGKVLHWEELKKTVRKMGDFAPQLEFFGMDVVITEDSFKFRRFLNCPKYPVTYTLSKETVEFLQYKLKEKEKFYTFSERRARAFKKIKLKVRSTFAKAFFPRGLKPYLSVRWIQEVWNDFWSNKDTSLKTKLWAYRHGYLSYRIPQYGITEENHLQFISDFEYKWLRHINGFYRVWFEDKITFQYILPQYKQYFPDYYYYIKNENGKTAIVPMMDCKDTDDRSFDAIFELVKDKGVLAMKPDEGSHGDGFYKFSYEDGNYFLNDSPAEAQQVIDILTNPDNQYLITEYIKNHPQFKAVYAGAVNTIRIIVFKKDGKTPEIGNVYMRFGSKATGAVDNMGAGGMFVQVDRETGWYGNAKIITNNSIEDCPHHPDTGVLIEGYIPHYEKIKEIILDMAANITELEYFGFDVAVTEDSIKLPEINRFPDFPKIEKYSQETIDYLLMKLEQKKRRYGYEDNKCKKLVHLPRR